MTDAINIDSDRIFELSSQAREGNKDAIGELNRIRERFGRYELDIVGDNGAERDDALKYLASGSYNHR